MKYNRNAFRVTFLGLSLILAACGGQSVPTDNASVGTFNYGGSSPGVIRILAGQITQPSTPDGFEVSLRDPDGNNVTTLKFLASSKGYNWWSWWSSSVSAKSGTYTVIANWPSGSKTYKVQVDPAKLLDRPQPSLTASQTSATISWAAVPGAKAYSVEFWQTDSQGNPQTRVRSWYTNGTLVQFNQLTLTQGTYYRAWVYAYEADLVDVPNVPSWLGKQVNASVRSTSPFQVSSLGTLRILDHLPDDVLPPQMER